MIRNAMTVLVAGFLMSWSVGCCSDGDPIRIGVQLNESVKDATADHYPDVTVDLVGVNPSEYAKWSEYSMTKYWDVDNPYGAHRGDLVFPVLLSDGAPKYLEKNDAIWDRWAKEGVKYIFVMSNYPKSGDDRAGAADSRRNIIPMECKRWDSRPDAVTVTIKSDGVTLNPSPQPEQK